MSARRCVHGVAIALAGSVNGDILRLGGLEKKCRVKRFGHCPGRFPCRKTALTRSPTGFVEIGQTCTSSSLGTPLISPAGRFRIGNLIGLPKTVLRGGLGTAVKAESATGSRRILALSTWFLKAWLRPARLGSALPHHFVRMFFFGAIYNLRCIRACCCPAKSKGQADNQTLAGRALGALHQQCRWSGARSADLQRMSR